MAEDERTTLTDEEVLDTLHFIAERLSDLTQQLQQQVGHTVDPERIAKIRTRFEELKAAQRRED